MKTLKIGLVGLGQWPRQAYIPVLKELATAQVVAVAASSSATRQFACEQFGEGLKTYGDYRDLLADDSVEAVMLALPNTLHAESLPAAIASCKHIFVEPPLAHKSEEISSILDSMEAYRQVVQLDLELRYLPVIAAIKRLLESGEIGKPLMAKTRLCGDWRRGSDGRQNANERQGFFPWLACWYLDLLDCVFPTPPVRASVTGAYSCGGSLMDHGFATLDFSGGGIGQYEFFLLGSETVSISLSVFASDGEIEADLVSSDWSWRKTNGPLHQKHSPASQPVHGFRGMRECILGFIDAALEGKPVLADVHVARRIHAGMVACMLAERTRQSIVIDK